MNINDKIIGICSICGGRVKGLFRDLSLELGVGERQISYVWHNNNKGGWGWLTKPSSVEVV